MKNTSLLALMVEDLRYYMYDIIFLEKGHNTILQILNKKKCDTSILRTLNTKKGHKHREEKTKWAKFTYVGRETRAVTKILKNSNVKVTFGTTTP